MNRKTGSGVVVAGIIAATAIAGLAAPSLFATPMHQVNIQLPTADGLLAGGDVLEAGAKVGHIDTVVPQEDNTARVTIDITGDHWPLHQGVTVAVRPKSLLGEKYVDITDGGKPQAFDAAQVLHGGATAVPVELDQFINSLDPATRAATQTLLDDFGAGVAGQGQNLNTAIATGRANLQHLAVTGKTLNNRDPQLDQVLVGLDSVLQKLTTPDQLTQFSQLISNGQTTLNAVETQKGAFSRSFNDAAATFTELSTAMDTAVPSLQSALNAAPDLTANLQTESALLAQVAAADNNPSVLNALRAGVTHGPTSTGGAVEVHSNGTTLPIFRICFITPAPAACSGNGFNGAQGATPASENGGQQMADLAAWLSS